MPLFQSCRGSHYTSHLETWRFGWMASYLNLSLGSAVQSKGAFWVYRSFCYKSTVSLTSFLTVPPLSTGDIQNCPQFCNEASESISSQNVASLTSWASDWMGVKCTTPPGRLKIVKLNFPTKSQVRHLGLNCSCNLIFSHYPLTQFANAKIC